DQGAADGIRGGNEPLDRAGDGRDGGIEEHRTENQRSIETFMEITLKDVPAQLLLSISAKLGGIPEIPAFAQKQMPMLYAKAKALGAQIAGPEVFIYHFQPGGSMQLRIGIPLREKKGDAGEFEYFTTAPVKCACANHK